MCFCYQITVFHFVCLLLMMNKVTTCTYDCIHYYIKMTIPILYITWMIEYKIGHMHMNE